MKFAIFSYCYDYLGYDDYRDSYADDYYGYGHGYDYGYDYRYYEDDYGYGGGHRSPAPRGRGIRGEPFTPTTIRWLSFPVISVPKHR